MEVHIIPNLYPLSINCQWKSRLCRKYLRFPNVIEHKVIPPLHLNFAFRSESKQWIFFWYLPAKLSDVSLSLSLVFMTHHSLIYAQPHAWTPCVFVQKGKLSELKMKKQGIFLSAVSCSSSQQHDWPRANGPPPLLTVLDTLNQGGRADPISWCCTLPTGGQNTPHLHSIYLLAPRASVWPPSNASGRPPWWFPLKKWLMPVYFRKAKPFPWLGSRDCRGAKNEWVGKRKWRRWGGDILRVEMLQRRESGQRWARVNQRQLAKAVQDPLWTWVTERCGKESKDFSLRMRCLLFIKQWNTDILLRAATTPGCCLTADSADWVQTEKPVCSSVCSKIKQQ